MSQEGPVVREAVGGRDEGRDELIEKVSSSSRSGSLLGGVGGRALLPPELLFTVATILKGAKVSFDVRRTHWYTFPISTCFLFRCFLLAKFAQLVQDIPGFLSRNDSGKKLQAALSSRWYFSFRMVEPIGIAGAVVEERLIRAEERVEERVEDMFVYCLSFRRSSEGKQLMS